MPLERSKAPQEEFPAHDALLPRWISDDARVQIHVLIKEAESDPHQQEKFTKKLITYCADFFWRHRREIHMLLTGEVLASKRVQDSRGVANHGGALEGIWIGAGMHTMTVGLLAELLARAMDLPAETVHEIGAAGVLHDWYKKHEVTALESAQAKLTAQSPEWKKTERARGAYIVKAALEQVKKEDEERLVREGISATVIELAGANLLRDAEGIFTREKLLREPQKAIIACVDSIVRGVEVLPRTVRMAPAFRSESAWSLYSEASENEYGKTFQKFGEEMLPYCETIIAKAIGYQGDEEHFPEHVRRLLITAIKKVAL